MINFTRLPPRLRERREREREGGGEGEGSIFFWCCDTNPPVLVELFLRAWHDKAIKVAVLEGEFASLVGLGFPLSLSIPLAASRELSDTLQGTMDSKIHQEWFLSQLTQEKRPPRRNRRRRREN
jgi:hypothetical protein